MHKHALSAWFRTGLRHLLPCACALCGAVQGGLVCSGCIGDLAPQLHRRRCIQCAIALESRHTARHCHACLAGAPDFDATVVIADYDWPLDHLVTGLKFRAQLPLAAWLAGQLGSALAAAPGDLPDVLLPVPLSPARLHSRGYNQAWEIARRVARERHRPARHDLLQRLRDTPHQIHLDRRQRDANLRGAFMPGGPSARAAVRGRCVALVDDVLTTGTTAGEAARALLEAGARCVHLWVLARTERNDG